ncbi:MULTISPECIES: hypothetical protein [Brachybacterium]|uniref:Uncharacterized protein n=2 Tax=Brachybacterium TaxID=43668 RepID=A0A3R8X8Y4_9MICO|nr:MULTISPECIES: hypothetical protein [Brachybacterium]RRR20488.1 hypothetical protein DS079_03625 [Brachybacterium paraconglomeratum]
MVMDIRQDDDLGAMVDVDDAVGEGPYRSAPCDDPAAGVGDRRPALGSSTDAPHRFGDPDHELVSEAWHQAFVVLSGGEEL